MKSQKNKKEKIIRAKLSDPVKITKKDIERFRAIKDEDIDFSDIPLADEEFFKNCEIVIFKPRPKKAISIRLEQDTLEWFKSKGKGYQTIISSILDTYYKAHKKKK